MDRIARLISICESLESRDEEYIAVWFVKQELTKHLKEVENERIQE